MQHSIRFFRDLQRLNPPIDADPEWVRKIDTPRLAMLVSLKAAAGMKQLVCSRLIGISEGHLSRVISGQRAMPEWFPDAFCWATGSNLLAQVIAFNDVLAGQVNERAAVRCLAQQIQCRPAVAEFIDRRKTA